MTVTVEYYESVTHRLIAELYGEREYRSWFSEEEYLRQFDPAELEYRSWGAA